MERIALVDAFLKDKNRGCGIPDGFTKGYQLMDMISTMQEAAGIGFDDNGFVNATAYTCANWRIYCRKHYMVANTQQYRDHLQNFCRWLRNNGKIVPADDTWITQNPAFVNSPLVESYVAHGDYHFKRNPYPFKYVNMFLRYLYYTWNLPVDHQDFSRLTPQMISAWKHDVLPNLCSPKMHMGQIRDFLTYLRNEHNASFSVKCIDEVTFQIDYARHVKEDVRERTRPLVCLYVQANRTRWADRTQVSYTHRIGRFLDAIESEYGCKIEDDRINGLTGVNLTRWYARRMAELSPSGLNGVVNAVRPFLRWAATAGVVQQDFSSILKNARAISPDELPPEERPAEKVYTSDQMQTLLDILPQDNLRSLSAWAATYTLAYTGLRAFEMASLRVRDFYGNNKDHGVIEIKRKGGRYAKVCIPDIVYSAVEKMMKFRRAAMAEHGESIMDNDPLFVWTPPRTSVTPDALRVYLQPYQERINIPTGLHVMRHTFISAIEKIGGVAVARDLANHKNIRITNRYDHSSIRQRLDAVNALDYDHDVRPGAEDTRLRKENSELRSRVDELERMLRDLKNIQAAQSVAEDTPPHDEDDGDDEEEVEDFLLVPDDGQWEDDEDL